MNKWLELGVLVGNGNHNAVADMISKKKITTNEYFDTYDDIVNNESVRFIQLSSVGNGIRSAAAYQWKNFLNSLKTFNGTDLFVFLQQSPSTFTDQLEGKLFKTVLEEASAEHGYNVWVFYAGSTDSVWLENGVRYFCCAGMSAAAANKETGANAKYLLVTYMDNRVTYEYKSVN